MNNCVLSSTSLSPIGNLTPKLKVTPSGVTLVPSGFVTNVKEPSSGTLFALSFAFNANSLNALPPACKLSFIHTLTKLNLVAKVNILLPYFLKRSSFPSSAFSTSSCNSFSFVGASTLASAGEEVAPLISLASFTIFCSFAFSVEALLPSALLVSLAFFLLSSSASFFFDCRSRKAL